MHCSFHKLPSHHVFQWESAQFSQSLVSIDRIYSVMSSIVYWHAWTLTYLSITGLSVTGVSGILLGFRVRGLGARGLELSYVHPSLGSGRESSEWIDDSQFWLLWTTTVIVSNTGNDKRPLKNWSSWVKKSLLRPHMGGRSPKSDRKLRPLARDNHGTRPEHHKVVQGAIR